MAIANQTTGATVVVLAAGIGSRFGGLKQLESVGVGGETLLEFSIYDAIRAGFTKAVLVVRPETEETLRRRFEDGMGRYIALDFVHQRLDDLPDGTVPPHGRVKPWGTGHAVLAAAAAVDGPFAVINADDFYGAESFVAMHGFLTREPPSATPAYAMIGFALGQTLSDSGPVSRALCELDRRGHLQTIVEVLEMWKHGDDGWYRATDGSQVEVPGDRLVSMNIWGFEPGLLEELERRFARFLELRGRELDSEFRLPDVIQELVTENRITVEVLREAGRWCGITFPEDREKVVALIAAMTDHGDYPAALWR